MGKSSRLAIVLAGARLFCLGVLALLLTLPCDSSVGAVNFTFNGFEESSLYLVSNSSWIFNTTTGCFHFNAGDFDILVATSGRLLYPFAVQMIDPGSTTVKSFSTSFIYQIVSTASHLGPGLAFILVPDNITLGASGDYMGLITSETSETEQNYESDNHTLGVEVDAYMNLAFNDTNNNHIGINLASMNSTYWFVPAYSLASSSATLYQQIWIDFNETDSRMDIYCANYKQGKPAEPQLSQSGLDLSLLKESMFTGFSTANKVGSSDVPHVCAWSFSNDGSPAPPIVIAQDATPGAPPPPAPVPPSPLPNGPVAAPSPAPIPSPPPGPVPTRSPAPDISSPPPPPASIPPPSRAPNPSPFNPPSPPPPSTVPPQGPSSEPPAMAKKAGKKKKLGAGAYVGISVAALLFSVVVGLFIFVLSHPLRTFVCHAGGKDGSEKNFPTWLVQRLRKYFKWSNIKFFFDRDNIRYGEIFPKRIVAELARVDVGIVVVTDAFFRGKWPMTELITLIDNHKKDTTGKFKVLPLFYKLSPDDIKKHLSDETCQWEPDWKEMSKGNHPLEVEMCRDAANWLCTPRGVEYIYEKRDHDDRYINDICQALDEILHRERSYASYFRMAIRLVRPSRVPSGRRLRMTGIPESEMVSP